MRTLLGVVLMTLAVSAHALDLGETLRGVMKPPETTQNNTVTPAAADTTRADNLKPKEVSSGLKEALVRGSEIAVAQLGQQDGFYDR